MTAAPRLVWELAGSPPPAAASAARHLQDHEAPCAICGVTEQVTADADAALGNNFADRGHLTRHDSSRICRACLWCCSGKPPATLRMWSIVATPGTPQPPSQPKAWLQDTPGMCLTNRANTAPIIDTLTHPPAGPWVVTVAVSGQKHVIPYATVNHGDGPWIVRVEDHNVTATPDQWATVHSAALTLRRLGVPADAVYDGEPRFIRTPDDLATWRRHNESLTGWHRTPLLNLALWTITKETMK